MAKLITENLESNLATEKYVDDKVIDIPGGGENPSYDDTEIRKELENKVDKEDGKGLSSNDFDDTAKSKLDGLENYDDTDVYKSISGESESRENAIETINETLGKLPQYMVTNVDKSVTVSSVTIDVSWSYMNDGHEQTFSQALPFATPSSPEHGTEGEEGYKPADPGHPGIQSVASAEWEKEAETRLQSLEAKGGTLKGVFTTYAQFTSSTQFQFVGLNINDFVKVADDENENDNMTLYYVIDNNGTKEWSIPLVTPDGLEIGLANTSTPGIVLSVQDIEPEEKIFGANDGGNYAEPNGSLWVIGWGRLVAWITSILGALTSHKSNTDNPHGVTKSQVGLDNVDNTADANKPVSTAQQAALDMRVPKSSLATILGNSHMVINGSITYVNNTTVKIQAQFVPLGNNPINQINTSGTTIAVDGGTAAQYTSDATFTLTNNNIIAYRRSINSFITGYYATYKQQEDDIYIGFLSAGRFFLWNGIKLNSANTTYLGSNS